MPPVSAPPPPPAAYAALRLANRDAALGHMLALMTRAPAFAEPRFGLVVGELVAAIAADAYALIRAPAGGIVAAAAWAPMADARAEAWLRGQAPLAVEPGSDCLAVILWVAADKTAHRVLKTAVRQQIGRPRRIYARRLKAGRAPRLLRFDLAKPSPPP